MINISKNSSVLVRKVGPDLKTETKQILGLFDETNKIKRGSLILIKPNWVSARDSRTGVTTTTEIVEGVIEFFNKKKCKIVIAEGSGYEFDTEKIFKILGVKKLTDKYGVPIINTRATKVARADLRGRAFKKINMPRIVLKADLIINIPKLKAHALSDITFSMKNLYGLLPDPERRDGHLKKIHQPLVDLNKYFTNVFTIVDAVYVMGGTGPVFGDTIKSDLLLAGCNTFAIDKTACEIVKIDPWFIRHLRYARQQGLIPKNINILGEKDARIDGFELPKVKALFRSGYWVVYYVDKILYALTKRSYIPLMITRLGTKVEIDKSRCNRCNKCVKVCPINAISTDFVIDFDACRSVRCFRCWDVCDQKAIKIKGMSRPKEKDE